VVLVESAPAAVRADVRVRHVYARALVEQGRDDDALAVERSVVARCAQAGRVAESADVGRLSPPPAACDAVLVASAARRVTILEELVALGVEDALAQPEVSLVAYKNATREARIAAE
jgi:hypothetical protein